MTEPTTPPADEQTARRLDAIVAEIARLSADLTDEQVAEVNAAMATEARRVIDWIRSGKPVTNEPEAAPSSVLALSDLSAPDWATDREEIEGGIRWSRDAKVEILPALTLPGTPSEWITVTASASDTLAVGEGGALSVVRSGDVEMYVGDERMTPRQACAVAHAILSVVDAVEKDR